MQTYTPVVSFPLHKLMTSHKIKMVPDFVWVGLASTIPLFAAAGISAYAGATAALPIWFVKYSISLLSVQSAVGISLSSYSAIRFVQSGSNNERPHND